MDDKLRVGLLLDSLTLSAWKFTAIQRLACSNDAELVLVVINRSLPTGGSAKRFYQKNSASWLYRVFNAIDEKIFLRTANALAQVDASSVFSQVPIIGMTPIDGNQGQYFSTSDVEKIKSYELDILVKLGFGELYGEILSVAKHGIWAYRWGDSRKIEDGLTGFWEVVRGWTETGAALQQLGDLYESNKTLFESWFSTYLYSPARNRNSVLWASASFLPRQVRHLKRLSGEKYYQKINEKTNETVGTLETNRPPSNLMVLWIFIKLAFRNLSEFYRRSFYREQWKLLFDFGSEVEKDFYEFKKITPPKDCFWADPHVVYEEPNYYIFIEEFLYRTRKGHISVIEMNKNGTCKPPIRVLSEGCHLSFPFVFNWMGHYYMIPESSGKGTIDLYECTEFPDRWRKKITLMKNIRAVDTTLFYRNGKWWMFTGISEQAAAAPQVELFLYHSDELFTDQWQSHPLNPIVSDVKRARAAGSIFEKDGKIFRPSQDCSKMYGYGFDLNEIVALSETEYSERIVSSVRPERGNSIYAMHTYAYLGNLTVIDALTYRLKWAKTV